MVVGLELAELCERFIEFLHELNEQSLISDDELQSHLKQKLKFLEDYEGKLKS